MLLACYMVMSPLEILCVDRLIWQLQIITAYGPLDTVINTEGYASTPLMGRPLGLLRGQGLLIV